MTFIKSLFDKIHPQVSRFLRLLIAALVASPVVGLVLSGHTTQAAVTGAIVAAFEVAYRQFLSKPVPAPNNTPGVNVPMKAITPYISTPQVQLVGGPTGPSGPANPSAGLPAPPPASAPRPPA